MVIYMNTLVNSSEPDQVKDEAAPVDAWDDEPTVEVRLESEPGRVSLETMVKIMTRGRHAV